MGGEGWARLAGEGGLQSEATETAGKVVARVMAGLRLLSSWVGRLEALGGLRRTG